MNKIEFTFDNGKTGERVHSYQDDDTVEAYERAAKKAQQLANKEQTEIRCTAWLEDREGASFFRYPRKRGRPPEPEAKTNAQRQADYRNRMKAQGICPCCGQEIKR